MNQSQIRNDIGFTFAQGLRGSLRQDPDIVMVGEIRDRDTLDAAMEASMTGHLVFSTGRYKLFFRNNDETYESWRATLYDDRNTESIVAQRLARMMHPAHKLKINVRDKEPVIPYPSAVQSLQSMPKAQLATELQVRGIDAATAKAFIEDGLAYIPDPAAGEKAMS